MPGLDSYVKTLMHFNGSSPDDQLSEWIDDFNLSTTFTPSAPTEGISRNSTTAKKFEFNGLQINYLNNLIINRNFNLGSGNFSIDLWVMGTGLAPKEAAHFPIISFQDGSTNNRLDLWGSLNGILVAEFWNNGADHLYPWINDNMPFPTTLTHLELTRLNGYYYIFLNGIKQIPTFQINSLFSLNATKLILGNDNIYPPFSSTILYMDELRVSVGIARHSSDFIVPTEEYMPLMLCWELTAEKTDGMIFRLNGDGSFPKEFEVPDTVILDTVLLIDEGVEIDKSEYTIKTI